MIGKGPDGKPFPPPDLAEEKRLETADLRAAPRGAQHERQQVAQRLDEQLAAVERAKRHHANAVSALDVLEDAEVEGSRLATEQLADLFRIGPKAEDGATPSPSAGSLAFEPSAGASSADPIAALGEARRTVEIAQRAVDRLTTEAEATDRDLRQAQNRVGAAVLDVIRAELLAIGREVAEHDRRAAELRSNLEQAGYTTANLASRHGWRTTRIFTSTTLAAMHPAPRDRPPAATVDWTRYITALDTDPDAQLT